MLMNLILAMLVEWAKAMAHSDRWKKEILLLTEEMRRVIQYLHWKSWWWSYQGHLRNTASDDINKGAIAYAAKQSDIWSSLATSFAARWHPILIENSIPTTWDAIYIPSTCLPLSLVPGPMDVD